jgi:HEAT repeats
MDRSTDDVERTRAEIASRDLVATASGYLTGDVAIALPFEALTEFKNLLKRFFSPGSWTDRDESALAELVTPHLDGGWWEHDLGGGITLAYGIRDNRFVLTAGGASGAATSLFDRAFDGPVVPEATPHPRKVRFATGGIPAPGEWYRRGDPIEDERVDRLFAEPDVTDVMVAGDFVTVGIDRSWEDRLEPILALVTELFGGDEASARPERTRDELLAEAGHVGRAAADELHLLDPNDVGHQARLIAALDEEDAAVRRVAVAILAESDEAGFRRSAVERGLADGSLRVRRTALDAAGDSGDEGFRTAFERVATEDPDAWSRWRAVRALGDLGVEPSRASVETALTDDEFRVRFEAERVLRQKR